MPLQKLSGVAIFVSLQESGFSIFFFHFISLKKRKYNDNPAQPADSKANRGGLHF